MLSFHSHVMEEDKLSMSFCKLQRLATMQPFIGSVLLLPEIIIIIAACQMILNFNSCVACIQYFYQCTHIRLCKCIITESSSEAMHVQAYNFHQIILYNFLSVKRVVPQGTDDPQLSSEGVSGGLGDLSQNKLDQYQRCNIKEILPFT